MDHLETGIRSYLEEVKLRTTWKHCLMQSRAKTNKHRTKKKLPRSSPCDHPSSSCSFLETLAPAHSKRAVPPPAIGVGFALTRTAALGKGFKAPSSTLMRMAGVSKAHCNKTSNARRRRIPPPTEREITQCGVRERAEQFDANNTSKTLKTRLTRVFRSATAINGFTANHVGSVRFRHHQTPKSSESGDAAHLLRALSEQLRQVQMEFLQRRW